jgi:hypothetical protein
MLFPDTFNDVEEDLITWDLHSKIWKKGYLYQKGGDTDVFSFTFIFRIGKNVSLL